jgi:hypothetical protein
LNLDFVSLIDFHIPCLIIQIYEQRINQTKIISSKNLTRKPKDAYGPQGFCTTVETL